MKDGEASDKVKATRRGKKFRKGAMNLVILGVASILIAAATTGVSLAIYHNSGDIYLDRSRPGYLPDEEEIEESEDEKMEYELEKSGKITMDVVEEYLENLDTETKAIDVYEDNFGSEALSDKHLGIPAE